MITWSEKTMAVAELKPYEKNPRKISAEAYARLKAAVQELGYHQRVIAQPDGRIIGGHQRIRVLKELGFDKVAVLIPSRELTTDEYRRLLIQDNLPFGEFDIDMLAADFSVPELEAWGMPEGILNKWPTRAQEGLIDPDAIPIAGNKPITLYGDIWCLGGHRLACGDSTKAEDVERLLDGQKADMVFTDPPYGVSYADKNKYLNAISPGNRIQTEIANDHMNLEDTSEFILAAFKSIKSILAPRSSYYITAPQGGDLMMMMMMMMTKAGLPLRHTLIWAKNNHVLGRTDYNYKHEPILYGWCKVHDFYGGGKHRFSVWEIDKPLKNDIHPTMKPVELVENAILNSTKPEQNVVDIFSGSGTTIIAAEITKRRCMAMELSPAYVDVAVQRWQAFTGKQAVHAVTGVVYGEQKSKQKDKVRAKGRK